MKVRMVCLVYAALIAATANGANSTAAKVTDPLDNIGAYTHLMEPREHPDYSRRHVKPPGWDVFSNQTRFTCLRGFNVQGEQIVGYREELEKFTRTFDLGEVVWPSYPILFATNLTDLAEEIRRRQLYLFDVWGYVPGSGPGGYWQQFKPPDQAFRALEEHLGERWLGTDIGEQDGRYIGGYANQMTPAAASRFDQYLNFQRHFERMSDDLGNRHSTLVSLNFGHYLLKEGTFALIGAETAQALPNNQVYYAFIRGAGKQYGVLWFGNASIYNRWGFKDYGGSGQSDGYEHGPTKGSSLSLLKRLLYSHILYNSVAVGFENGWFQGEALSPIGRIQQSAQRWVKAQGSPGVMHAPVALLLDFYSGWTFPRHLYTDKLYRVWGNLPYNEGDFQTDAILNLIYPGYADSSYFHDEAGFITATPYGDIADCLLSDAPLWLLERYPVLVVAGELAGGREIRDKLEAYAAAGGHLVLAAANLERLPGGVGGVVPAPGGAPLTSKHGRGKVTILAGPAGVPGSGNSSPAIKSRVDQPLVSPTPLPAQTRAALEKIFRAQMLFEANPRLATITCRRTGGEYVLGVFNNAWQELPLELHSRCGDIKSIRELSIDRSEYSAPGYLPESVSASELGTNTSLSIAGGDVRMFAITVAETGVREIEPVRPPPAPRGRLLPLRVPRSIKEEILARPTFFEHFDGAVVDWQYLANREPSVIAGEAGWVKRQGLRIVVDFSSGIDLYPALRLINNLPGDYATSWLSLTNVLSKMELLGAHDLLFSLHRHPENNFTEAETRAAFDSTLKELATAAQRRGVTLHLRMAFGKPPWSLAEASSLLERVKAPNLRLAPSTALLAATQSAPTSLSPAILAKSGFWLAAASKNDLAGLLWNAHAPLHSSDQLDRVREYLRAAADLPVIFDAVYENQDEEYLDARDLEPVPGSPR